MEVLLLLALMFAASPRALGDSPGLAARITNQGLEYVAEKGLEALQRKLHTIALPDISGKFKRRGHYEIRSLSVQSCELGHFALAPLPGQGLSVSVADSFFKVHGKWKIRMSFVAHQRGHKVDRRTRSPEGRAGPESWLWTISCPMDGERSKLRREMESKICEMVQHSVTSDLQPYLQTLPVTAEIDSFASIDYSLMEAPRATDRSLDVMFKGEFFNPGHHTPVPFSAPAMSFPEEYDRMVYFTISDYVFNTASLVYHQAGYLNFTITDDKIPPNSTIRLNTQSFRAFAPQLARKYPNMNMELQGSLASAPFLTISPGNLSLAPQIEIEAFVLQPSSVKEPVFRLAVATNISAVLTINNNITGFLKPGKIQLELKESSVGVFNVEFLEALLNYYILNTLYPMVNEKLAEGFPLPLPSSIQLDDLVLQTHKDFLSLGANVQYLKTEAEEAAGSLEATAGSASCIS
ncbi:lipopolysaccharide-binding protein-like [Sorex araneus]|uniref:lipopolysaccharide-binding protein-like n=1 Tax=Sorex araneus TaxID=42254 RepID=UPI00243392A1|nr:lipopolysaccharide-binding protein-like [Sorex araneus]